jgi:folate-binding protein YgfZ
MNSLPLREFHHTLGAKFFTVNGCEVVANYGDTLAEHAALRSSAGVLDLSFRSRICLVGGDRVRFLHGQVTNDVKSLRAGSGCYAALTTGKGKMQSDLNIHCLADELLLDFEPGLTAMVYERLQKFIVADDVQIVDAAPHYGLLSVQGPQAEIALRALGLFPEMPTALFASIKISDAMLGEIYLMNLPRTGSVGFDLFVPTNSLGAVADKLIAAAKQIGGRAVGWDALEITRVEAGVPRFGADMDETNLPPECGIEARAMNYNKGCYIGQEVLNRVHSFGHVNRELRGLRLEKSAMRGDKLFFDGKEVGQIMSAVFSPTLKANLALGCVRKEGNQIGTTLVLRNVDGESRAQVVELPFK